MRQEFDTKALADQLDKAEEQGIKKGIIKMLSFFANYPRPTEWIRHISNGDKTMESHLTTKWHQYCDSNKTTAGAIIEFYNYLDSRNTARFIEYIATKFTK